MGSSPTGSSVHGILQARILGWVVILFSGFKPHTLPTLSLPSGISACQYWGRHVENTRWNYCFQSGPHFLPLLRLLTRFGTSAFLSLKLQNRAYIPSLLNPSSWVYGLPVLSLSLKHACCKYTYTFAILHSGLCIPALLKLPFQTRFHHQLNFHSKA